MKTFLTTQYIYPLEVHSYCKFLASFNFDSNYQVNILICLSVLCSLSFYLMYIHYSVYLMFICVSDNSYGDHLCIYSSDIHLLHCCQSVHVMFNSSSDVHLFIWCPSAPLMFILMCMCSHLMFFFSSCVHMIHLILLMFILCSSFHLMFPLFI